MPTSTQAKLKKGVDAAIAARGKRRVRPALSKLAKLPGDQAARLDLQSYVRKARDRLVHMAAETASVHEAITKKRTKEYEHYGMYQGEKPGVWGYNKGFDGDIAIRERNKAIEKDKAAHAKTTEEPRNNVIQALRSVRSDLNLADPLTHSQIAMLLRSTMGDGKRAQYMRTLQGAGVVAIENAVLDAIMGDGNKPLGAAIVQILENDEALAGRVKFSREDIADQLMHDQYWLAQESIGLTRYFIEQSEVAVLELEGKRISTDRKMRAGIMRTELEKATGKTFSEAGDEVDEEGQVVKPATVSSGDEHKDFYDKLHAESRARDAVVVAEKRKQAAAKKKADEDEVARITKEDRAYWETDEGKAILAARPS